MSAQNGSGGEDATGIIIVIVILGLMLYFYQYVIFFFWIPTKMAELWIWSQFHPHYTVNLRHFVDTVTLKTLHWKEAEYVNGQVLSIGAAPGTGHGWIKPVAFLQTGLALLMAGLVWLKVRQHGMHPVSSVTQLVSLQRQQFPWGWFWLKKPQTRQTMLRPHEVFGKQPEFAHTFPILLKQLGRRHLAFDELPDKLQALYAAFVMQNNGQIDEAQAQLRALALGSIPKLINPNQAEKDWNTRNARFHFERTCFADALFHARSQNLLPPSWFNWLKIEDRALWMTLNSVPPYRKVIKPLRCAAEAVGPLSWWIYVQYRPLESNVDDELKLAFGSISTLEEALKEVDYAG
ncbi:MAG: secretion/conjugation apparatus DotM-related subunit [Acidithiobacillus ferriphilus]